MSRAPAFWAGRSGASCPMPSCASASARSAKRRLSAELRGDAEQRAARFQAGIESLRASPIAIHTDAANAQHYELPPAFFQFCLGTRLKYSCAYFERGDENLDQAEEAMLERYAERAELGDGQNILELGCGWGSLTLWMARALPARPHPRSLELTLAARVHRGRVPASRGSATCA